MAKSCLLPPRSALSRLAERSLKGGDEKVCSPRTIAECGILGSAIPIQ